MLLASPPVDLLRNSTLTEFLYPLIDSSELSDGFRDRVRAVKTIQAFWTSPSFESETQASVAKAFAVEPSVVPGGTKAETFDKVVSALAASHQSTELQSRLETTLVQLGSTLASNPTDLFENILRSLRTQTDFAKDTNFVPTFLGVALGAVQSPELAGKLDGLDGHAFAIASDAAKRGGVKMLAEVDRRAESWPKAAKTQWSFLSAAVRPRGTAGLLRDIALVAAGVVGASLVWLVILGVK
jgi:hypothetical protein